MLSCDLWARSAYEGANPCFQGSIIGGILRILGIIR